MSWKVKVSLVSENVVQGQGHKGQGQGHRGQGQVCRSRSKVTRVKVVGQGLRVKIKFVGGPLYPIDWRELRHTGVFIKTNPHML